jgi:predicted TPR repeat methyltransferase
LLQKERLPPPASLPARSTPAGGAGLLGEAIRGRVDRPTGVDLPPRMIAQARPRGIYDALEVGEASAFLNRSAPGAFDLILAADALCYFGDLRLVFAASVPALAEPRLAAFSIETFEGEAIGSTGPCASLTRVITSKATAREAGFRPHLMRAASTRRETGADAPGLFCVFEAAGR